jgi:hypothetical protein
MASREMQSADWVFITAKGHRYHGSEVCPGLETGQRGAEAAGQQLRPIERVTMAEVERRGRGPCRHPDCFLGWGRLRA